VGGSFTGSLHTSAFSLHILLTRAMHLHLLQNYKQVLLQVIVEKMIEYLRTTSDDVQKADVVKRLGELAERFAPDTQWFIDTMNQVSIFLGLTREREGGVIRATSGCCCHRVVSHGSTS